jgi:hypothetical protein
MVTTVGIWQPFIDNPRSGRDPAAAEPKCPAPSGRGEDYSLAAAPMPAYYDPHGYSERALYACVLLTAGGKMLDVHLLRGTGDAALDQDLIGTIRQGWRFSSNGPERKAPSWQRVRLNSGLSDRDVSERMMLL